ncbi:hypothetical protein MT349_19790 [Rathayibacter caricis]|uniref:AbiTii domain-containing protein n=1 Tax=Rathayibacter caricis TaxID=110936 RepID=UPI001FB39A14|nr:hypothetical protein [Rathayibacter caricis]MCJ1698032.1 hypothetical protein [Rathayibacter caricis]
MTDPTSPSLLAEIERDLLDGAPVADVLRKLIVLGGRAGSSELRGWAATELRGYEDTPVDDLPAYRRIHALIQVDSVSLTAQTSHQTIGVHDLPDEVQPHITNMVPFWQGVGELQAMINGAGSGNSVRIALPGERALAQLMQQANRDPHLYISAIYWAVSTSALHGVLDQVRTRLAELLGELRAATPSTEDVPTPAQAAQAVSIVIHGRNARVQVAQSDREGSAALDSSPPGDTRGPFWTIGRRIWGAVIGLATIAATIIAWIQLT